MVCPRDLWLEISRSPNAVALIEHKHPYLNLALPNSEQTPLNIVLIGQSGKNAALHQLLYRTASGKPRHGSVHLMSDPITRKQQSPLIFADCELHDMDCENPRWTCAEADQKPLAWADSELDPLALQTVAWRLYARVLAPLAHVICLFAAHMRGLKGAAKKLAT